MSGFLGLATGGEHAATNNLNNVFNYALPAAQAGAKSGSTNQSTAAGFFNKLLAPGRTQASINAAPATNAAIDSADAAKRQEAATGTSRGGGTAGANREAGATTTKTVDDIINQNMMGGQQTAAKGLAGIGADQTSEANQLLGLGTKAGEDVLGSQEHMQGQEASVGKSIGNLAMDAVGLFL